MRGCRLSRAPPARGSPCTQAGVSDDFVATSFYGGNNPWGQDKGVFRLVPRRARRLLVSVSQHQAQRYAVDRCVALWVAKVEDMAGNVITSDADEPVNLTVLSTASQPDGSKATIVANWYAGPACLEAPTADGIALLVTFAFELELVNLQLAAPVRLTKKVAVRVEAPGSADSAAGGRKPFFGLFGGKTAKKRPNAAVDDPAQREHLVRAVDSHHHVFMGDWQRTEEAVRRQREDMLRTMRGELNADVDSATVVEDLRAGLERLERALAAEEKKQRQALEATLNSARRLAAAAGAGAR